LRLTRDLPCSAEHPVSERPCRPCLSARDSSACLRRCSSDDHRGRPSAGADRDPLPGRRRRRAVAPHAGTRQRHRDRAHGAAGQGLRRAERIAPGPAGGRPASSTATTIDATSSIPSGSTVDSSVPGSNPGRGATRVKGLAMHVPNPIVVPGPPCPTRVQSSPEHGPGPGSNTVRTSGCLTHCRRDRAPNSARRASGHD
jgi:hypothetical protein